MQDENKLYKDGMLCYYIILDWLTTLAQNLRWFSKMRLAGCANRTMIGMALTGA